MVVGDLITNAFRKAGIADQSIALSADELSRGLTVYNGMVAEMRGAEIGVKLSPRVLSVDATAFNGARYQNVSGSTHGLSTPPNPKAGSRFGASVSTGAVVVQASPFSIEGSTATVSLTAPDYRTWFFADHAGNWVREEDAGDDDDVVFADEVVEPLTTALAFKLAGEYGLPATDEAKNDYVDALKRIARRYGSSARNRVI